VSDHIKLAEVKNRDLTLKDNHNLDKSDYNSKSIIKTNNSRLSTNVDSKYTDLKNDNFNNSVSIKSNSQNKLSFHNNINISVDELLMDSKYQ